MLLRGHLCISGDVQATLLTVDKPMDVGAYYRKLIDEIGTDGSFILSTGCEVAYVATRARLTTA